MPSAAVGREGSSGPGEDRPGLEEVSPEDSSEGLMLKLHYFDPLIQTADSLEKTLMLGKIEGRRRRGCPRMKGLDGITDLTDLNLSKLCARVDREAWRAAFSGVTESDMTEWLNSSPTSGWL